ncbi:MAG TPA: cysteine desulfurase [Ruminococcaceae bacterium]|nr:cysteine desulfurase [Oscillospiraceae bacterium]
MSEKRGEGLRAYFDNSSTTPVCAPAMEKIREMMEETYGNPSSLHEMGIFAELELKKARKIIADEAGCEPSEIMFCSGGSEANNTALFGAAVKTRPLGDHIITTAVEHMSVLEPLKRLENQGASVEYLPPLEDGTFSADAIVQAAGDKTVLVSVMLCNNETGAVLPVKEAVRALRKKAPKAIIHCDAVQAFCKMPVDVKDLDADLVSFSAHKLHGPKGIGALYIKKGLLLPPLILGGPQENGRRAGTENTPHVAGFGIAVREMASLDKSLIIKMKNQIISGLEAIPGAVVNSPREALPFIINFSVPGIRSEIMLHFLERRGIYVSSASACSKNRRSHVLMAQKLPQELLDSALRVSLSRMNTPGECDYFLETLEFAAKTLRNHRGA